MPTHYRAGIYALSSSDPFERDHRRLIGENGAGAQTGPTVFSRYIPSYIPQHNRSHRRLSEFYDFWSIQYHLCACVLVSTSRYLVLGKLNLLMIRFILKIDCVLINALNLPPFLSIHPGISFGLISPAHPAHNTAPQTNAHIL
jgi:hypothetical protein